MNNLTLEKFENGVEIFQDESLYKFTADSISLAKFCNIKSTDHVLDMCAGSGVIGLYAYSIKSFAKLYLNDIQECMCDLMQKNIMHNKLSDKCKVICKDLAALNISDFGKHLDIIMCNPPYFKLNAGEVKDDVNIAMCRHELCTNLESIISKSSGLIKDKGKFYICIPADRLCETIILLNKYRFEAKRMQISYHNINARLCLIECVKNAKSGIKIEMMKEGL